ncbi:hypothetical protein K3495_g7449 [Podosphaera aphanis]|nr:hypothetical protein K3495_g7449 [Podosphaera aphanis]
MTEVSRNNRDPFLGDENCANEIVLSSVEGDHDSEDAESFIPVGFNFSSLQLFDLKSIESFYTSFAMKRGLTIRESNAYFSQKLKANTRREFTCSKHGKASLKQDENVCYRRSTRTGCRARLYISLEEGCWIVKFFQDSHNHTLLVEEEVLLMPYHRKFNDIAKQKILQMRRSGIPAKTIREMLHIEMNNPSLQSKDIQNYASGRVGAMKQQDAQILLDYFQQKRRESPDFVYYLRTDDQSKITDVFWIDPDAKSLFRSYSDVVVLDTTYPVNAYKLPFAPFVGLDKNEISILFGCALIQSETAETFEWLLREWCLANDEFSYCN